MIGPADPAPSSPSDVTIAEQLVELAGCSMPTSWRSWSLWRTGSRVVARSTALHVDTDRLDFVAEARAEMRDALVYLGAQIVRLNRTRGTR